MEYITAMDIEEDRVLPYQQLQEPTTLAAREMSLSAKDYDSFITANKIQGVTRTSSFTKCDSLPLLIRRNSSKQDTNVKSSDKENTFSQALSLLKSHSITRSNSASSEGRKVNGSFRNVDEPLQDMDLSRSTSLENSLVLQKSSDVDNFTKEPTPGKDDISVQKSINKDVKTCSDREVNSVLCSEKNHNQFCSSQDSSSKPDNEQLSNEKSGDFTDETSSSSDNEEDETEKPDNPTETHRVDNNFVLLESDNSVQSSSEYDDADNENRGDPSSDCQINDASQNDSSSVEETSESNEMGDIHTLATQRKYVQIVLNSIFKNSNGNANSASHDADQTPSSHSATESDPQSPERLGMITPSKRRSSSSSDDTPSKKSRITRSSVTKLTKQSPNRSLYSILQKKDQIFKAAEKGDLEMVKDLLYHTGPSIRSSKKGYTLLHTAAAHNQKDVVLYLLDFISPNVVNKDGQTPAHLAAERGYTQILEILMEDTEFGGNKLDKRRRTFEDQLVGPLFEAVATEDKERTMALSKLGADPDNNGGEVIGRLLARELGVTTPRQLADVLHGEPFLHLLPKISPRRLDMSSVNEQRTGPGSEKNKNSNAGYFCILNFKSFYGRADFTRESSSAGVKRLANFFRKRGCKGNVHNSLTGEGTKQTLQRIANSQELNRAKCAIFVISSHSANKESFLTSDLKVLTTEWLMRLFSDSGCPQLKNKPKLFIFDFDSGYYMKSLHPPSEEKTVRVQEPLTNMIGLYSNNNTMASDTCDSSFLKILCRTLRVHGTDKDILDVHKELLKECIKRQCCSLPELRSFGVSRRYCLNL